MVRIAVAALVALALTPFATAEGATSSCQAGYSYSGLQNGGPAAGVAASIRFARPAAVRAGHVAAWVGVGGVGLGPGGSSEWLQTGIAFVAGGKAALYYEVRRPQDPGVRFVELRPVAVGQTHRFAVAEVKSDVWVATIDGQRVSPRVSLPGSNDFPPVATAESWNGGRAGVCNRFAFDFMKLSTRASGAWRAFHPARVFHDPGYVLSLRADGFAAASR